MSLFKYSQKKSQRLFWLIRVLPLIKQLFDAISQCYRTYHNRDHVRSMPGWYRGRCSLVNVDSFSDNPVNHPFSDWLKQRLLKINFIGLTLYIAFNTPLNKLFIIAERQFMRMALQLLICPLQT